MKKLIYMSSMALIVAFGLFWSCQKDETLTNPDEGLLLKGGKAPVVASENEFEYIDHACVNVVHTFTLNSAIKENLGIQAEFSTDIWTSIGQMSQSTENSTSFEYIFDTEGVVQLRYKIGSGGYTKGFYITVENCSECDDANFSYETDDNLDITFKYNHYEEAELTIQFTFPQVTDARLNEDGRYVGADGKLYEVNNPENQNVFTWTGPVSCLSGEAETFHFVHVADCSAPSAKDGNANIWTDTKIIAINGVTLVDDPLTVGIDEGPVSLKGENQNIVYGDCPVNK